MSLQEIALRAWAEPADFAFRVPSSNDKRELPEYALVIDTETTIDATQALLFGSYRRLVLNDPGHPPGSCIEEGVFCPDDLATTNPEGFEILREFVTEHGADLDVPHYRRGLRSYTLSEFIRRVFYRWAYKKQALVVGFNLPFDLSRLAIDVGHARKSFGGGFSFTLWDYSDKEGRLQANPNRPRLVIKSLNSKQHLFRFTDRRSGDPEDYETEESPDGTERRTAFSGHFLDLRTLTFALTDRSYTLEKACEAFAVEHGKQKTETHGIITPQYIEYNRRDVKATGELLMKCLEEFGRHPIPLQATKAFSPASIAKAYQKSMGIVPVLARQHEFAEEYLGYSMNAYFGGRAEARIRRVAVPVVYTDFVSMYPTVNALMDNWRLLTAQEIQVVETTDEVRDFLNGISLDMCFDLRTWSRFAAFVKVRADGEVFPVRAQYNPHGHSWQIGSNPLTSEDGLWLALPDVTAAMLLSGKTPKVLEAFRLVPVGKQKGMRSTSLRGAIPICPRKDDFFRVVIEERKRIQRAADIEEGERDRLDKSLKVTANSGSYGIFAEMNRKELPGNATAPATVWNCDGEEFKTRVSAPEIPGPYCFPPLAALITSAARLMLALLECSVRERGGAYVFCDTDSMAIVASEHGGLMPCPGGQHRMPDGREAVKALSWQEVNDIVERFATLNPYDHEAVPGSVLKVEDENYDAETGEQTELCCYAISAKRYVLYNLNGHGRPLIRKSSRHGLGHLLNPKDPDSRDDSWIDEVWRYILAVDVFGDDVSEPEWFARPAISRVGVNDPRTLALFETLNKSEPYARQIKPFNFMLSAHVAPFGHPPGVDPAHFHLVAPFSSKPGQWLKLAWFDRYSGKRYRVTVGEHAGEGVVRIKTYRDVVSEYRCHPEHKSLAPDAQPCSQSTVGLLRRRPVGALRLVYVGKESNRLEEVQHGLIQDEDEVMTEYADPTNDPLVLFVLPVLRDMPLKMLAQLSELNPSTLKRIRAGKSRPHARSRDQLRALAVQYARTQLTSAGIALPREGLATLHQYLAWSRGRQRTCPVCGNEVESPRATYCGATCRKRAAREEDHGRQGLRNRQRGRGG